MTIKWDDVVLGETVVERALVIGQVAKMESVTSPRGLAQLLLTIKDSTGHTRVTFYYDESVEELGKQTGLYVKAAIAPKVGGLAYRP